ncbi:DUF192 domain-containing protein [Guyparkeria sp. 1SP6A2]|nr:DUF192 domain-containing protein [Guyparkeria sp. 1SP6A2]
MNPIVSRRPVTPPWLAIGLLAVLFTIWLALPSAPVISGETRPMIIAGKTFHVELANDPASRRRGLMHRSELPANRGMLFTYPDEASRSFWMKDVRFSLDLLFLDRHWRLVHLVEHAPPCTGNDCPGYGRGVEAQYVLELPAGTAARLALENGARLDPPADLPGEAPIRK